MGGIALSSVIFLSASVPDPGRSPVYASSADSVAIASAVTALIGVVLGRRLLVWGGHPAITPMIWAVAESVRVDYGCWVQLYQSRHFQENFPEDNEKFRNVTFTADVPGDRAASLFMMRKEMFTAHSFTDAVFIGGMEGIIEEYELLHKIHPGANMIPVVSTGGATIEVARRIKRVAGDLSEDLDYVAMFHRHLRISPRERRYYRPTEQPTSIDDRLWPKP